MGKTFRDKVKVNHRGGWADYGHGGNRLLKGREEDWEDNLDTILGGNQREKRISGSGGEVNYNLVRRWLKAQVGHPWNEIKHRMTVETKSVSAHIADKFRYAVDWMVEEKVKITPEGILDYRGRKLDGLYIDDHGNLQNSPRKKYQRPKSTELDRVNVSKELELVKNDGIWYRVDKRPVVQNLYTIMTSRGPLELPEPIQTTLYWEEYQRKTLSSKELKKHGLQNDPEVETEKSYKL